jgi:hypothetical protein
MQQPPAQPVAACVREGLAPIHVTLRAVVQRAEGAGRPELAIRWSGKPLAAGCEATRTVSFQATLWFPHLRYSFTEGLELNWLEFWNGRKAVSGEEERRGGNSTYQGLGCIYKTRARLRYEVVAPGGAVLGKRIVRAPVKLPPCWE